jgi:hypothetical protein
MRLMQTTLGSQRGNGMGDRYPPLPEWCPCCAGRVDRRFDASYIHRHDAARRRPAVTARADPVDGTRDFDVDAHRLVWLVRISRDLRFGWRLALFATLLWGAFVLSVERTRPEGSAQWNRVDADASRGFIILLVIAGVAFVAQSAVRLAGKTGKAAGLIVPSIGEPAPTDTTDGAENVSGLLPVLRQNSYVGFGVLTALLVVTAILVATVADAGPAWAGNHGRGGHVVTIGQDATVTTRAGHYSGRGGTGVINTLHTSHGDADAVGNTPHAGERWTIVSDPLGASDGAYLVGGHAYLLNVFLGLAFLLLEVAIIGFAAYRIRSERRRRNQTGHVSLADSYRALESGARATVVVGKAGVGYKGRPIPPLTVVVGATRRRRQVG